MCAREAELLTHDHVELSGLLGQLIAALEANDVARSHATLDLFWARLAVHIRAEHLHLFPTALHAVANRVTTNGVAAPTPGELESAIAELRDDHEFFMRALLQSIVMLRRLLAYSKEDVAAQLEDLSTSMNTVKTRLVRHNEIEENGIYVWTKNLLSEAEQHMLNARMHKELTQMPPRFGIEHNVDG
jgi:hemerythrin-like domain-containing protein